MSVSKRNYSDFANGTIHMDIHYEGLGLFKDPCDIAFALSTDGAQLTKEALKYLDTNPNSSKSTC